MSINKVILFGRATKDPEVRNAGGNTVCSFSVATDESYKDKQGSWQKKSEFHNVVVWGKQAEYAGNYLRKGDPVGIEGKLSTRKWEDKSGNTRYTTEVVADKVEFMKSGGGERQPENVRQDVTELDDAPF